MLKRLLLTLCLLVLATVAAADGFKVSDILLEGNSRIETSTIMAAIPIKPGDVVTLEDVDAAMRNIFRLGWFEDISAELTEVQGAKLLTFVVAELPLVREIRYAGNEELSEETLRKLVTVKIPEIYDHAKVKQSVLAIEKKYAEEGYHAAKVEPKIDVDEDNEATLTFQVSEGEKTLIDEISFVGNKALSDDELKGAIETRERWWLSWLTGRGAYREDIMELDLERIKAAYHDKGYMDVKVKPAQVSLTKDNKYLKVEIEIDEGPQYRVGSVDIKGDLLKPKDQLLEMVRLHTGEIFSRSELRNSILALTDLYADQGYANVNVAPLTSKHTEQLTIDLMLDIEQGTKVFIEGVKIRGNTKTRDKVIRREIPLVEGEQYSASKIKEANRNIRNLGYFEEVNVTTSPGSDPSQAILDVDVKEQPTGTFSVGAGYSSVDQFIGQGSISQDNFMGYGVRLNLSGSLSANSVTYSLGVSDPHFLDTDWTLGVELYKLEREENDYDQNKTGGALTAGHPILDKDTKGYLTYRYEKQEIFNIVPNASLIIQDQEGKSTLSSLTFGLMRNSTDYHQDPSKGGISKATLEYAGLGGTEDFAKIQLEHRHFFPFYWGTVFSVHGEIGYLTATGDKETPLGERFYLGGINNMRGFTTREVGPKEGTNFIGGEKMAYANFEYIFPIYKELGLKGLFFYDVGNSWTDEQDYFSDLRHSVGAGIRWQSPLGPLRFEWGYNLDPRDDEKDSVFEFSIGKAF